MSLSILQNVSQVELDPFPHVAIGEALPIGLYQELEKARPSVEFITGNSAESHMSNRRIDKNASKLLGETIPRIWKDFIEYHTSKDFWLEIVAKFGATIRKTYPNLEKTCGSMESWATGVRFKEKAFMSLECQIGVNTPVTRLASRVRGPHVDNPVELFAGLLYMRPEEDLSRGGDLLIHRSKKPIEELIFKSKAEVADEDVELVKKVEYRANTFVGFVSSRASIHSVTQREVGAPARLLVNFCAEVPFGLFTLRR